MLKDRTPDPCAPAFTAVNGRNLLLLACISNSTSGMSAEQRLLLQHERCDCLSLSSLDTLYSPNKRKHKEFLEEKSDWVRAIESLQYCLLPAIQRPSEPGRRWTAEP
jgi:hypothetical protein